MSQSLLRWEKKRGVNSFVAEESGRRRKLSGLWSYLVFWTGMLMSAFHLVVLTFYPIDPWVLRALHLTFASGLVLLLHPARKGSRQDRPSPPVMGTAAFIMAEYTGIPYAKIIVAAAIPAILYYAAVYFMLDFEAISLGLLGLPRKYLPRFWETIKSGAHMLIPIGVLVYMLVGLMSSPTLSAAGAMAAVVVCSWFRRKTRMMPRAVGISLSKGAQGVLEVAVTCGMAGIIVGILTLTGLGLKFTSLLLALAGNNLLFLLILTAVVCLILGIGMGLAIHRFRTEKDTVKGVQERGRYVA